jgi:hypothetical protein
MLVSGVCAIVRALFGLLEADFSYHANDIFHAIYRII